MEKQLLKDFKKLFKKKKTEEKLIIKKMRIATLKCIYIYIYNFFRSPVNLLYITFLHSTQVTVE